MIARFLFAAAAAALAGTCVVALPALPAIAQEVAESFPAPAESDDGFVRFAPSGHDVSFSPLVDQEVVSRTTVTKIGFGKTSDVNILTTPTGTYSSDAIGSPNVRYPGISVRRTRSSEDANFGGLISIWQRGLGWVSLPLSGAGSFALLTHPSQGTSLVTTEDGNCFVGRNGVFC